MSALGEMLAETRPNIVSSGRGTIEKKPSLPPGITKREMLGKIDPKYNMGSSKRTNVDSTPRRTSTLPPGITKREMLGKIPKKSKSDGSPKGTFGGRESTLPPGITKKDSHYAEARLGEMLEKIDKSASKVQGQDHNRGSRGGTTEKTLPPGITKRDSHYAQERPAPPPGSIHP